MLWQEFLEDRFPAYTYSPTSSEKVLNRPNTAHKLLFDQTLCAFVNTVAFVAAMAAFKGKNVKAVRRDVERVWPISCARERGTLQRKDRDG